MKITKIAILAICCVSISSCATIIHGSNQNIAFSSNPSGAEVYINEHNKGITPVTVRLRRNEDCNIKIQLENYLPYEISLVRKVDGWIAGNIIFGGLIGLAIDAATGSMYKLSSDQVTAELKKKQPTFTHRGDNIYIAVVMTADSSWEKIGSLKGTN
jgi:hypothetical protein